MRKILSAFIIICLVLSTSFLVSAEGTKNEKNDQNPYIKQYINEKSSANVKDVTKNEYLVDPQVEEEEIISALNYYYNEDVRTVDVLKKLYKDSDLSEKTLSTKKEDKVSIMHKIKKVYPTVEDQGDQEILRGYLLRYAQDSKDKELISFLDEINSQAQSQYTAKLNSSVTLAATAAYNSGGAATWAYNNYNKYSTNFPDLRDNGGDCTNFVSQAMNLGGGMPMQSNWYCYKKNNTYPKPTSGTQLDYSWSYGTSWIRVTDFSSFLSSRSTTHIYSYQQYVNNHSTIYNSEIVRGDVVIFHKGYIFGWVSVFLPTQDASTLLKLDVRLEIC